MLLRLKIFIYKIKTGPPYVLKAPLNYNPYILFATISLDHLWFPLLGRRIEVLFLLFAGSPFHKTLVTPHD
jgi:hypothetical protein